MKIAFGHDAEGQFLRSVVVFEPLYPRLAELQESVVETSRKVVDFAGWPAEVKSRLVASPTGVDNLIDDLVERGGVN
jgi:hypothetical protein